MACKTENIMSKNAAVKMNETPKNEMIANKRETAANYSSRKTHSPKTCRNSTTATETTQKIV